MTPEEWKALPMAEPGSWYFEQLMTKTEKEAEHPDGYDGPCGCQSCQEDAQR